MKSLNLILAACIGLACLMALGLGAYFAITWVVSVLSKLDSQFAMLTAIASLAILLAAMVVAGSIRQAIKQHKAKTLHIEKAASYQLFTDLWVSLLRPGRDAEERSPERLSAELQALDRLLVLYGTSGVIKGQAVLRALVRENGAQNLQVRKQFATLLMEIRQDLGTETKGLTAAELLPLLFADADQTSDLANVSPYQDRTPRVSLASHF